MQVSVTGIGLLCALGDDPAAVRARLADGASGVAPLNVPGAPVAHGARVEGPRLRPWLKRRKDVRLFSRASKLALPAAGTALGDWAGDREQLGLFVGVRREPSDGGEADDALAASARDGQLDAALLAGPGRDRYPPLLPLKTLPNMALAHIAIALGVRGESGTCAGGPDAGRMAVREAIEAICEGRCPAALAGATDSWVDDYSLQAWARMGRTDPPGEAAIFFLLEPSGAPGALFELRRDALAAPGGAAHRAALGHCGVADALLSLALG